MINNNDNDLMYVIFERYLPNNDDAILIGNVTFKNYDGRIIANVPPKDWNVYLMISDILKLIKDKPI